MCLSYPQAPPPLPESNSLRTAEPSGDLATEENSFVICVAGSASHYKAAFALVPLKSGVA